jgi:hypothetical protein
MMIQRLADGIAAVVGAAALSQFPEFYQQYLQRLGGRLDQAAVQRDRIVAAATEHALAIQDYVRHLAENPDAVVRSEGANAAAALADAARLNAAHDALVGATPWERPLAFARGFDPDLARATWERFVPAVPLSPESLIYGGVGLVLGLTLLALVERIVLAPFRRRRLARL